MNDAQKQFCDIIFDGIADINLRPHEAIDAMTFVVGIILAAVDELARRAPISQEIN